MLDMGFLPDVRRILARLPSARQTLLFSATMPPEVVALSREFLHAPRVVRTNPTKVAASGISHRALEVMPERKTDALVGLLRDPAMASVLVFVRTKHRADRLLRQLSHHGVRAGVIHGNRSQNQRVRALEEFRRGRHRVLVATDIAARGLDVEDVSHVINYDLPGEPDVYVHRVGRTARAQKRGDAVSLVTREDREAVAQIERLIGQPLRLVPSPTAGVPARPRTFPPPSRGAPTGSRRGPTDPRMRRAHPSA